MYRYWLSNIKEISGRKKKACIALTEDERSLYHMTNQQLQNMNILEKNEIDAIQISKTKWNLEEEYFKMCERGIHIAAYKDSDYPQRLRFIRDAPYAIYYKGKLPDHKTPSAAIVGARMNTPYGRLYARKIAEMLSRNGYAIISGMAKGTDRFAHLGAIKSGGETYALLAGGVDICYPPENYDIYQEIPKQGGLISEYPIGIKPIAKFFPTRNRLISGLADLVIIIEAKEKSGSLITGDFALEQGKEIYVLPGRIDDPVSKGCNLLIRQGAQMIASLDSFAEDLRLDEKQNEAEYHLPNFGLEKEETLVYSCLSLTPKSVESIFTESGLKLREVINALQRLQSIGLIEEYCKNYYIRSS